MSHCLSCTLGDFCLKCDTSSGYYLMPDNSACVSCNIYNGYYYKSGVCTSKLKWFSFYFL